MEAAQQVLNQLIEGCQNAGYTLPATTITSFTEFPSATAGVTGSESPVGSGTMTTATDSPRGNPGGFSNGPTPNISATDGAQMTATAATSAVNGAAGWGDLSTAVNGPMLGVLLLYVAFALPV
ncbi:hypothetical protein FRC04_004446 [Tulasnella sp. 424]|nr:hypothetical protein FRC04_004446 [Tulasnella sp. 424]KAG8967454.1 hypothetical protein FRC05_002049 [Tulasnella sp. 425]